MHPVLENWLNRLERDEDPQIIMKMTDGEGSYCAIGILADECVKAGMGRWDFNRFLTTEDEREGIPSAGSMYDLPLELYEQLGVNGERLGCRVVHLNDSEKLTFPQIGGRLRETIGEYLKQEGRKEG